MSGVPAHPAPIYGSFGNWLTGDCEYAAMANLFEHQYPNEHLTTAQVLSAYGGAAGSDGAPGETYMSAIDYMGTVGFNGHTATIRPVRTRPGVIYAANHGGIWATVESGAHAVAIVGANAKGVMVVDSTMSTHMRFFEPWSYWANLAGKGEEYWWVKWNPIS